MHIGPFGDITAKRKLHDDDDDDLPEDRRPVNDMARPRHHWQNVYVENNVKVQWLMGNLLRPSLYFDLSSVIMTTRLFSQFMFLIHF